MDDSNILVVSRLHGRGKQSGAELEARDFHVRVFRGRIVGWHQSFERASALEAAGLRE